jgi:hypothetical protein
MHGDGRHNVNPPAHSTQRLKLRRFVAKIALDNTPSLALFCKLGFVKTSECADFGEATLELNADGAFDSLFAKLVASAGDITPVSGSDADPRGRSAAPSGCESANTDADSDGVARSMRLEAAWDDIEPAYSTYMLPDE